MTDNQKDKVTDKLIGIYARFVAALDKAWYEVEDKTETQFHHLMDASKKRAHEVEEATKEEVDNVAHFVKRDLEHAGKVMKDTGKQVSDLLAFDRDLFTERFWDFCSRAADQSLLDRQEFERLLQDGPDYKTGEVTGLGCLICKSCDHEMHFTHVSRIPPCQKCHHTVFVQRHGS